MSSVQKYSLMDAVEASNAIKDVHKNYNLTTVGDVAKRTNKVREIKFITNSKQFLKDHGREFKETLQHNGKIFKYTINYFSNKLLGNFLEMAPSHVVVNLRKALKDKGYKLTDSGVTQIESKDKVPNLTVKKMYELADMKYHPLSYYS